MMRLSKKLIIVINGKGGVGKDLFCNAVGENFRIMNISAVDLVKDLAAMAGWDGEKTDKSRKFLSDLKGLLIEFNDAPLKDLLQKCKTFEMCDYDVLFVHIREAAEIHKFMYHVRTRCHHAISILIKRDTMYKVYGNPSDDNVENYGYSYIYNNCQSLENAPEDMLKFFFGMLEKEGISWGA